MKLGFSYITAGIIYITYIANNTVNLFFSLPLAALQYIQGHFLTSNSFPIIPASLILSQYFDYYKNACYDDWGKWK